MSAEDERSGSDPSETIALVAAYQGGSSGALETLLERYYPRVRRIVRARMGKLLLRSVEVEDIVQQVFMRVVRDLDRFSVDHDARFISWVATLVERELANTARDLQAHKRDRRREVALQALRGGGLEQSMSFDAPAEGPGPATQVGREELEDHLDACLGELREDLREVILLRNHAGGSWEWVAEQLGRPSADAARKLHARAMIDLRDLVQRAT